MLVLPLAVTAALKLIRSVRRRSTDMVLTTLMDIILEEERKITELKIMVIPHLLRFQVTDLLVIKEDLLEIKEASKEEMLDSREEMLDSKEETLD